MQWVHVVLLSALGSAVASPAASGPVTAEASTTAALDAGIAYYKTADFVAARTALRPLADRGSAIAETLMGVMAAKGQGRPADPAVAAGWWLRAASRGYAPAQLALAKALAQGKGISADPGQAWVWAKLASSTGNGTATQAMVLADRLFEGFDAETRARLETERAAWRPWPSR